MKLHRSILSCLGCSLFFLLAFQHSACTTEWITLFPSTSEFSDAADSGWMDQAHERTETRESQTETAYGEPEYHNPSEERPDTTPLSCLSKCKKQGDCTGCSSGRTHCVLGRCVRFPKCTGSCTENRDCRACSGGKAWCRQGKCSSQLPVCSPRCRYSSDCRDCSDGRTQCVRGQCVARISLRCLGFPCRSQSSCFCSTATRPVKCTNVARGNACLEPSYPSCPIRCNSASDCRSCPSNRTICGATPWGFGVCISQKFLCTRVCRRDSDCRLCSTGSRVCILGFCQEPGSCKVSSDCKDRSKMCVHRYCVSRR